MAAVEVSVVALEQSGIGPVGLDYLASCRTRCDGCYRQNTPPP